MRRKPIVCGAFAAVLAATLIVVAVDVFSAPEYGEEMDFGWFFSGLIGAFILFAEAESFHTVYYWFFGRRNVRKTALTLMGTGLALVCAIPWLFCSPNAYLFLWEIAGIEGRVYLAVKILFAVEFVREKKKRDAA